MTVKEMRDLLFAIDNENLTVKEMRGILLDELNQRLGVTADLFNRADVESETRLTVLTGRMTPTIEAG